MPTTATVPISFERDRTREAYEVTIGSGILSQLQELIALEQYTRIAILTEELVATHWLDTLSEALGTVAFVITVPSGETAKDMKSASHIWNELLAHRFDRRSLLINLGGGAICDLGGFAASTYMRGIDFVHIPTTLLSAVDASVGGKVGINHGGIKNSVGTFTQPEAVVIDVDTLATLPERERNAGFAEILKHGFIRSEQYLEECSRMDISSCTSEELISVVTGSVRIKADVVVADEREGGVRKILNFGHTVGHALESLSHDADFGGSPLLHGEAIALGMVAEAKLSELIGLIETAQFDFVRDVIKAGKLPIRLSGKVSQEQVLEKMVRDKKNIGGEVLWTLLQSPGHAVFDQRVDAKLLPSALQSIL